MSNNNNDEINVNITIKRKHLALALVAIITTSIVIPYQIFAQNQSMPTQASEPVNSAPVSSPALAPLTNAFCTPTAGAVVIESNYIASLTTSTAGAIKFIDITWPIGFDVAGAMLVEKTGIGAGSLSVAGQTTTYTVAAPSPVVIAAGTPISIMISNIVNPTTVSNTCTITTKNATPAIIDGPTPSAVFSLKKVGSAQLLKGAVTSDKIADGTIIGADVNSGTTLNISNLLIGGTPQIGTWNSRIPLGTVVNTVDSAGTVGNSNSITIGTDGLPVISYLDSTNGDLKVAHCGNTVCSSGNTITTIDAAGDVGSFTSITIGTDGLPVISYLDSTNKDLKVAHCGNISCSTGNAVTTVDSAGDIGSPNSITIGTDGLPVISYYDRTNSDLKVLHCGNILCTAGNTIATVDSTGNVGNSNSITIGTDGLPVISYLDSVVKLKVAHCGNTDCSAGNILRVIDTAVDPEVLGGQTSITIGMDGLPIISYNEQPDFDSPDTFLRVAHCGDTDCSTGYTITTETQLGNDIDQQTSITIGADGLPVIVFIHTGVAGAAVMHCGNLVCSSGNSDATVDFGAFQPSVTIGADGLPVISYVGGADFDDLKVSKCGSTLCKPFWTRR